VSPPATARIVETSITRGSQSFATLNCFEVAGYELGRGPTDETGARPTTYWGVDDVAQAVTDAEANGATRLEAPQDVGDGISVASARTRVDTSSV